MILQRPESERRKDPRLENNIPVKICQEGGDLVTETQNISRSGAYCCVNRFIEPMTKLKIHLLLSPPKGEKGAAKKISCEGVVVRSEPLPDGVDYSVAIFFNDITKKDAQSITDYVNAHLIENEAA